MKIEKLEISKIKPNPENPRIISQAKLDQLVKSLKEFPEMLELRPLVINKNNMVLGGNQRLKALEALGIKSVSVVRAENLTETQQKEFIIKDNLSFGEWDLNSLGEHFDLDLVQDWGFDMPEEFKEEEPLEAVEDDFESEPIEQIKTDIKHGDIIQIGPHRLMCGDSTELADVERLMDGAKADMVFTDPPYGMNVVSGSGVLKDRYMDILGDDSPDVAKKSYELFMAMFPKAGHVWWGANYYASTLRDSECWLVWDKNNGGSDQTDCELAWCNFRSVVRQFTLASEKKDRVHPTQKPIQLISWVFNKFSQDSKAVIDPFLGSGSTMVACHQLKRVCYGMELEPKYCQVIIDRMKKLDPEIKIAKV